jgi:excisionase family DNA binding protein
MMVLPCAGNAMPKVITVAEAAERLGVHDRTIRRWIREGKLKPYKLAGDTRRFVSVDEVEALREPQEYQPPERTLGATDSPAAGLAAQKARTADGRPVMVAAIIPHPEGRPEVLMTGRVRAAVRVWSWVGGHVHAGEAPEQAVIRELTEELEVDDPRVVRLLGKVDTHIDASPWWGRRFSRGYESYNFLVTVRSPRVEVIDHEELASVAWRPVDEVAEALAPLPPDLAEPALEFARQAIAHLAPAEIRPEEEGER